MPKFRDDNTEGFSARDLRMLNAVFDRIHDEKPRLDENNVTGAINKSWIGGISEADLYKLAAKRLEHIET